MALKSVSFIMIASFLLASSLFGVSTAFGGRKAMAPGGGGEVTANPPDFGINLGFLPINPEDPKVVAIAKFAIEENNKEHNANLVYTTVYEALYAEDAQGTRKYALVVAATDDKVLNDYSVSVVVAKGSQKVVAFQENK
ncbi:hypothetical protein ABFS82_13G133100 [Erythranthe guttata]|uniref:uncharacterized protein LOC105968322 n=1 Tax=Erythranthe guttata TaxID=4155 RepID=UPI00064DCE96|nr:PREDICTED: uncharacterized protein LOC105968322 [Erythranthe guttata]|eukprot:XP_012848405.1 PREDICTED: uncharacterized protein LOC105968322 [Erythranthe guttata]